MKSNNNFQIGDWVSERMPGSGRLSPSMRIVGIWQDTVYLQIDPEQGDPFEVDIKDIQPIPITEEILMNNQMYGEYLYDKGHLMVCPYEDRWTAEYKLNHSVHFLIQRIYFNYVHELQHFISAVGETKEIVL